MNDRDVMALLAAANPVRVDELPQIDFPDLPRRRAQGRLLLVAAAAVLVAGAAASIAVFAFPSSHPSAGPGPGALRAGTPWQTVALSDASTALGAPVVLPNTDFVQPSDAASQTRTPDCSADSCAIFVSFPAQSLGISYTRPAPFADPRAQWAADVRTAPAHHAEAQLVDLNGVPGDYIDYPGVKRLIEFVTGDTWIVVGGAGDYHKATLQAVAQSILDQSGTQGSLIGPAGSMATIAHPLGNGKQVSFADAAQAFGGEIVQPDTSVVSESDAGAVWLASSAQVTTVAVTYPRADVWVDYTWPASFDGGYDDRLLRYHRTQTTLLDGVPAQVVFHSWKQRRWSGFYPSLHFAAGGVDISVEGRQDKTALEAIGRSIVARSQNPPGGQLGDAGGVQVYPYLGHGKQIPLSEASATLGSRVVPPDSQLAPTDGAQAWAEGTCPHPAADLATTEVCAVWISFPGSGLSVGYIRPPAYLGTGKEWRLQARGLRSHGAAVRLDGVPALSIHRNLRAGYPGRVELDLGGTRVVVAGDYSPARLQEVAQSIVDRARRAVPGPAKTQLAEPVTPDLHVGSVQSADALLPFNLVLPSAEPLVIEVSPPMGRTRQSTAFFDTPATGPYQVVEQPADNLAEIRTVAQLRKWARTCRSRVVCPIHKIVDVHGTHVLLIGAPGRPGGLTAFWLRGDQPRSVLTWVQGPTDYAHGDLPRHRFKPRAALAVAADIIRRGG